MVLTADAATAVTADAGTTPTVTVGADAWRERQSQNNSRFREDQQRLGVRASLPAVTGGAVVTGGAAVTRAIEHHHRNGELYGRLDAQTCRSASFPHVSSKLV